MLVTKQLTVAIDFHSIYLKLLATINCWVTSILRISSFVLNKKKERERMSK